MCFSVKLFFCLSIYLSVYPFLCLSTFLSIHFSVYPFPVYISVYVCLYFCLSICLPNYLFDSISAVSILRSIPIYIYVIYQSISSGGRVFPTKSMQCRLPSHLQVAVRNCLLGREAVGVQKTIFEGGPNGWGIPWLPWLKLY
jgi:hypothetical protein